MGNLGKIQVKAVIGGEMPGMTAGYYYSVQDLPSGDAYEQFSRNLESPPKDVEFVEDPIGGGYMVMPAYRHQLVANYVQGASSSVTLANPRIIWEVLPYDGGGVLTTCIGFDELEKMIKNTGQTIVAPNAALGSTKYLDSYRGPRWDIPRGVKMIAPPDDSNPASTASSSSTTTPTSSTTPSTGTGAAAVPPATPDTFSLAYVAQEAICDDIWWSIETSSLAENNGAAGGAGGDGGGNAGGSSGSNSGGNSRSRRSRAPGDSFIDLYPAGGSNGGGSSGGSGSEGGNGNGNNNNNGNKNNTVGMPFFIDVSLNRPLAVKQTTFFALRIGDLAQQQAQADASAPKDILDFVFADGVPAVLYDWGMPVQIPATAASGSTPATAATWKPAKINMPQTLAWDNHIHRIIFIPMAGKLRIIIDGESFLYTRMDLRPVSSGVSSASSGSASGGSSSGSGSAASTATSTTRGAVPFFPSMKKIRAIGTNSQVVLSLGEIYFPEKAVFHTNMQGGFDQSPSVNSTTLALHGAKNGLATSAADARVTLVHLPNEQSGTPNLGAWAKLCDGVTLNATDTWGAWAAGKMHGELKFELVDNTIGAAAGSAVGKHYALSFWPEQSDFGVFDAGVEQKFNLAPIWFRARGVVKNLRTSSTVFNQMDASDDVMDVTEAFQSPDRYHVTHTLDITLYNENGTYDAICEKSVPIQVGLRWIDLSSASTASEITTNFFTGVTLSSSRALVAGKETVTVHCEDYMFILDSTLIINSPYYDGMDGFNVVQDAVMRANIDAIDDTGTAAGDRYFLASGYSFLQPAKRYDSKETLKNICVDVCSSGDKVVYFDGDGKLHYTQIQGGIAFTTPPSDITADVTYTSDPSAGTDKTIVLDEKRTETKLNSTVNRIVVKSIERTSRAIIMVSQTATTAADRLSYRKTMYASIPSLGSFDAVVTQIERWKPRFFKAIRGITIKTADDTLVIPMNFMDVDGEKYRIMSINRSIRADDNSITTSMTGEWMGDYNVVGTTP